VFYKPRLIITKNDLVRALVFTERFWKKAEKKCIEEKVMDVINDIVLKLYESNIINDPKISRKDCIYRIKIGQYRIFYKIDRKRKWMIFFDIDKRNEHTYRHERTFDTHNILW